MIPGFAVRPARPEELAAVCKLRVSAYERHPYLRTMSASLAKCDQYDADGVTTTYVAVNGHDLLGTIRVIESERRRAYYPRDMLRAVPTPDCLKYPHLHLDRFAVEADASVAPFLVKAAILHAEANGYGYGTAVVKPAAARLYKRLGAMMPEFDGCTFDYGRKGVDSRVMLVSSKGREDLLKISPTYYHDFFVCKHPFIEVAHEPTIWPEEVTA